MSDGVCVCVCCLLRVSLCCLLRVCPCCLPPSACVDALCTTADGRSWTVSRRYSEFKSLRDRVAKLKTSTARLPFPKKTWSGSGIDEATVAARSTGLAEWAQEVIERNGFFCTHMCSFLCETRSFLTVFSKTGSGQRAVFSHVYTKNDLFTKTGSGHA